MSLAEIDRLSRELEKVRLDRTVAREADDRVTYMRLLHRGADLNMQIQKLKSQMPEPVTFDYPPTDGTTLQSATISESPPAPDWHSGSTASRNRDGAGGLIL